jgi:hypothetical protein
MTNEEKDAARILFVYHGQTLDEIVSVLPVNLSELRRFKQGWEKQRASFETQRQTLLAKVDRLLQYRIRQMEESYELTGVLPPDKLLFDLKSALTKTGVTIDTARTVATMFSDHLENTELPEDLRAAIQQEIGRFLNQLDVMLLLQGNKQAW